MTTNPVERIIALAASAFDRAAIPPPAPAPHKIEQRAGADLDAAIARHRAEQRAAAHALPPCPVCGFGGYNGRCAACWHTDNRTARR